jgi:NitT/TauT family transport system ATP-binding protein
LFDVSLRHLRFAYDKELVLGDINLETRAGDFVCLLGQSGCGKSTLLRLIAGLERSDPGQLLVGGKPVERPSLDRAMIFQDYGLFPWMSAGDNIDIALRQKFKGMEKAERRKITLEWMKNIELDEGFYDKLPLELSGGQRQRFAIARAFAIDPPLLLMDEPFGALDAVTKSLLQDTVLELWQKVGERRKTVFFVTHSVDEALILGTHIVLMGQSPSRIIHTHAFAPGEKPHRDTMYSDPKVMELRNHLIRLIEEDIQQKVKSQKLGAAGGAGKA